MEKKNILYIVIIVVLVVFLGSVSGILAYESKTHADAVKHYEETIAELKTDIQKLERASDKKDSILEEKNQEIRQYKEREKSIQELLPELEKVDREIAFYEYACAIVIDNNSKRYHKYGCGDINWESDFSFWVYTSNEAEHKGYYACPTCH